MSNELLKVSSKLKDTEVEMNDTKIWFKATKEDLIRKNIEVQRLREEQNSIFIKNESLEREANTYWVVIK